MADIVTNFRKTPDGNVSISNTVLTDRYTSTSVASTMTPQELSDTLRDNDITLPEPTPILPKAGDVVRYKANRAAGVFYVDSIYVDPRDKISYAIMMCLGTDGIQPHLAKLDAVYSVPVENLSTRGQIIREDLLSSKAD